MAFISSLPVTSSARLSLSQSTPLRPSSRHAVRAPKRPTATPVTPVTTTTPRMEFEISEGVPFKIDLGILVLAFGGWVAPSSIPAGIPLTNGAGLTPAFFDSVSENLANFPKGPALEDPFWLLMVLWHIGLFACMIFGTIGFNLRKAQE